VAEIEEMNKYHATIDSGEGGSETFAADTAREALVQAIEWAKEGDWGDGGYDINVEVKNIDDENDSASEEVYIPTDEEKQDAELEDAEVLAESEGEWSTKKIVRLGAQAFYQHENGGERGAWDRQDGDGVWRERPIEPTREISQTEARKLLLDWGYDPKEIAQKTHALKDRC
jgi:hypothetical protein